MYLKILNPVRLIKFKDNYHTYISTHSRRWWDKESKCIRGSSSWSGELHQNSLSRTSFSPLENKNSGLLTPKFLGFRIVSNNFL